MGQVIATVDFGTSHTVAVVSGPGLPARLVTVDGHPWFPSAVFWTGQGEPVVGTDALRLARTEPARLEPRPKSRLAEPDVLLGDAVVATTTLVRAVLARVVEEASITAGSPVQHLVLTHPANWGSTRIGALLAAAQGLAPRLSTVSEPVAAAAWFAGRNDFPTTAALGVLDFGGGTCDAAVVRAGRDGLTVAGCAGLPDLGGDDLDQRIVDWVRAGEPTLAGLLDDQQRARPEQMAALLRFRDDVRAAKEVLSRHPQAEIALPGDLPDRLLTRAEFEDLVRADLTRGVELLTEVVTGCGLAPADLLAVHLVGGASQVPLLGSLLAEATGAQIRLDESPQSVVALGGHALTVSEQDGQVPTGPVDSDATQRVTVAGYPPTGPTAVHPVPTGPVPLPPAPQQAKRWPWVAAAAGLTAAALVTAVTVSLGDDQRVTGQAVGAGGGADVERFTLPAPVDGNPITVPGRSTERLPVVQKGQTVEYESGGATLTWRVDAFVDTPEQSAELAEAGVPVDDAHRLVLVRISAGTKDKKADPGVVEANTFVVDDRGLMITQAPNFRLDGCPERGGVDELNPGETRESCLAFEVGRTAPITEVALATAATRYPGSSQLTEGARVPLTGQRVDGAPQQVPAGALPPGGVHAFVSEYDGGTGAEVAVVDLVANPSRYFTSEPIQLPGTRGVLARLAVRKADGAERIPGLFVVLRDDRGTAVEQATSANVDAHDCTGDVSLSDADGLQQLCVLFALPTGSPVRNVAVSADGRDWVEWAVS